MAAPPDARRPRGHRAWGASWAGWCQLWAESQSALGFLSRSPGSGLGGPRRPEPRLLCSCERGSQPRDLATGLQGQVHKARPWTQRGGTPHRAPLPGPGTGRPLAGRGTRSGAQPRFSCSPASVPAASSEKTLPVVSNLRCLGRKRKQHRKHARLPGSAGTAFGEHPRVQRSSLGASVRDAGSVVPRPTWYENPDYPREASAWDA